MAKKTRGIGLTMASPQPCAPTKEQAAQERRWRAESDLRTLREAEQVKADPARVRMAQTVAKEEMAALARVAKRGR